ncbi:MAG: PQQ-binding-like beta-propeller repeat protein [Pirellulales bacterium]
MLRLASRVALASWLVVLSFAVLRGAAAADPQLGLAAYPKLSATDWPWWRGPERNGKTAPTTSVPTAWSDTQNVAWKAPVPGRGHSSPVVVGERVYLTTADERQQVHSVLAFDRDSGRQLWKTDVSRGGFPARNHPKNTEATSTLACDGERLYASFYHHDSLEAITLSLDGQIAWRKTAGPFHPRRYEYGYAPSPLLFGDAVIYSAEHDGPSYLTALDRTTGAVRWKQARKENITFSSPVVASVGGRLQLLLSGANQVSSYDPSNGKPLWSVEGTTAATCGTMVWDGDIVIASGGYPKAETLAVRADGSGQVLWRNNQKCYEQSLLATAGHVYGLTDNGVLFCWRVKDGQEMWKQRLRGPVSSSPILVGQNIFWANELGTTYVFRATPERFESVAENQLGTESFASPAVSGDRLFLRAATGHGESRQEFLYCLKSSKN